MKSKILGILAMALLAAPSAPASAASISTIFASNNSGAPGGGVYFDVTVGPNPLLVTSLATNTSALVPFTLDIYTRVGTYSGNETNIAGWTLVAAGVGTGAGTNNPSVVTFTSFLLNAGTTYGFALAIGPTADNRYTNGTGGNQIYSNADLTITTGSATNTAFSSGVFSPRVWNGTINYDVVLSVPEPGTLALLGLGLLGLGVTRRRAA